MSPYESRFYRYTTSLASESAAIVCPLLHAQFAPGSVLDVGCGKGAWLAEWSRFGAQIKGIDFPGAAHGGLVIPEENFVALDISRGFQLSQRFDLVQCLEVAEHIPPDQSSTLVESLAGCADLVLFSAAPPGQGGDNHVNEKPFEYWRELWARQGFLAYDCLRPQLAATKCVAPWYRYNTFLYANAAGRKRLSKELLDTVVPGHRRLPDVAPMMYRLRRLIVRLIPPGVQTSMSRLRYRRHSRRAADDAFHNKS